MKNEKDGDRKAGEPVDDGLPGLNREPYTGQAKDGESCTMTDGRGGKIVRDSTGRYCVANE